MANFDSKLQSNSKSRMSNDTVERLKDRVRVSVDSIKTKIIFIKWPFSNENNYEQDI